MPIDAIIPPTPAPRVVFLDFDGVLNNYHSFAKGHRTPHGPGEVRGLDPENVGMFVQWLTQPGHENVRIVVSSSWRLHSEWPDLAAQMVRAGIPEDRIVGRTQDIAGWDNGIRGREICKWLADHMGRHAHCPDFVIIDDLFQSEFYPLESHLAQTSDMTGFNESTAEKASLILQTARANPRIVVEIATVGRWSLR